MANPKLTQRIDDGKGREKPVPIRPDVFPLSRQRDWTGGNLKAGEWVWVETFDIDFLILACPFCGMESPLPHTTKITSGDPLTLAEEISCGNCGDSFHVINNQAIRSWGTIKVPERI